MAKYLIDVIGSHPKMTSPYDWLPPRHCLQHTYGGVFTGVVDLLWNQQHVYVCLPASSIAPTSPQAAMSDDMVCRLLEHDVTTTARIALQVVAELVAAAAGQSKGGVLQVSR